MKVEPFGKSPDQEPVERVTLENRLGTAAKILTYGGTLASLAVPGKDGKPGEVVLGHERLEPYLDSNPFLGSLVGRYANRIAGGRFRLNGKEYILATNQKENHLHGGVRGFDKVVWKGETFENAEGEGVTLRYHSPDGEEGYPGNLDVAVTYTLTWRNELKLDYEAVSDKDTVINLTQHAYFNLAGEGDVLDHRLRIVASRYTPVDSSQIPTGDLQPVAGTPFDFRRPQAVGSRIGETHPQLEIGLGYDHNWVLDREGNDLELAAELSDPKSGRRMAVLTTQPGMQFYAGNLLDGSIRGRDGRALGRHAGLCLETQHFPDSPNRPEFPSTLLKAGERFQSSTIYRFL